MPAKHAILGPSSAYRWLTCTPSARFEEQLPEEESPYAAEGTLAHDLAALILSTRAGLFKGNQATFNQMLNKIEEDAIAFYVSIGNDNGKNEFREMFDHAEAWAGFILDKGGEIHIEHEYDISQYVPLGFGTSDATNVNKTVLHVSDYKYGAGVKVGATANKQLMLYAVGALLVAMKAGHKIETIVLSIFQPRAGGSSSWDISAEALLKWAEEEVKPQALKAIAGIGDFLPGSHCQFCKARTNCKAYYDRFAVVKKVMDKRAMAPEEKAVVLTFGPLVATWAKKVEEEAIKDIQANRPIPGFKLVAGRGRRAFKNEDNVVDILLGEGLDSDDIFNSALKSLTDLEKQIGPKKFGQLFAEEVINNPGKPQLAPDDDPRVAIGASAADDYDDDLL